MRRFPGEYVRLVCPLTEDGVLGIYALLQHTVDTLVVHRDLMVWPSLRMLRACRGRVKVVVEEKDPFRVVVDHFQGFGTFVLVGYEFNAFEHEFLRQASAANRKSVLLFSEGCGASGSYRLARLGPDSLQQALCYETDPNFEFHSQ